MDAFEPPKYLASLIAAINDGAKSAQAGVFLFLLVGLYLLATAFAASDEDLLLGRALTITQIGASLPVSFTFVITPMVFVFLHIYALVRFDLLAANVQQFRKELRQTVPQEPDRERCRQLLANGEFIVTLTAPRGSALYSWFWPWLFRGIIAAFPVVVLLLVQINALRYQSEPIVWAQRAWLALDLIAVIGFFWRNPLGARTRRGAPGRRWACLLWMPCLIAAVNGLYLNTVPATADARLIRYDPTGLSQPMDWWPYAAGNPLDLLACPWLGVGCRFLRIDHRTLIAKAWNEKAVGVLRTLKGNAVTDSAKRATALGAVEGVFLRGRALRFAVLDESRLYGADLRDADLAGAGLNAADLSQGKLVLVALTAATLTNARLIGADLTEARLYRATLFHADLSGADLTGAHLGGADLRQADLTDAQLTNADLTDADLTDAQGLTQAQLNTACGVDARLPPGLTLKPCPPTAVALRLNPR